jgi:hypothetical protein
MMPITPVVIRQKSSLLQRKQHKRWERWGQFCSILGLLNYMLSSIKNPEQRAYIYAAQENIKAALAITINQKD